MKNSKKPLKIIFFKVPTVFIKFWCPKLALGSAMSYATYSPEVCGLHFLEKISSSVQTTNL